MSDSIYVKRNGVTNHWGVWVDPNILITGVVSNNQAVQFISDECMSGIDLDYEDHIRSPFHQEENCECLDDYWESTTWLIGDWILDSDDLYTHDPNGEYTAIVRVDVTQVVFSKYTQRSNLCSPCYPGQGDIGSEGDYLAYDLPPEAYENY